MGFCTIIDFFKVIRVRSGEIGIKILRLVLIFRYRRFLFNFLGYRF